MMEPMSRKAVESRTTTLEEFDRMSEYCRGIIARQARYIEELEAMVTDNSKASDQHLTTAQVALLTGISAAKLQQMRANAEGPAFTKRGRMVRYRRADVEAWLAAGRVEPGSDNSQRSR
jgi:predicted DNA-binding transcriptional regulator AlpA